MTRLVASPITPACETVVIVPVRDEASTLRSTLRALCNQRLLTGSPLAHDSYEVIVFLNNCRDSSIAVARQFHREHPEFALHLIERDLPQRLANVGTVRRLLMDEASLRLHRCGVILSTDGDTVVAGDWICRNLYEIRKGADAVGGAIHLNPNDPAKLSAQAGIRYREDLAYNHLVARLESLLDPLLHDPWPRHHQHFGASLACTAALYRRTGGLPAVDTLEDVAFFESISRFDARVRHSPLVKVFTSARSRGRVRVGLSSQLQQWQNAPKCPVVDSAEFLYRYFRYRKQLRRVWTQPHKHSKNAFQSLAAQIRLPVSEVTQMVERSSTFGLLTAAFDFRRRLWNLYPKGRRSAPVRQAVSDLRKLTGLLAAAAHRSDNALHECFGAIPIPVETERSYEPDPRSGDNP